MQHFVKTEDASAALNALDDSEFQGSNIQVQVGNCHLSRPSHSLTLSFWQYICTFDAFLGFLPHIAVYFVCLCEQAEKVITSLCWQHSDVSIRYEYVSDVCDLFTHLPFLPFDAHPHQFARTKGHGYGRGSGPPRPRFGGGRGLVCLDVTFSVLLLSRRPLPTNFPIPLCVCCCTTPLSPLPLPLSLSVSLTDGVSTCVPGVSSSIVGARLPPADKLNPTPPPGGVPFVSHSLRLSVSDFRFSLSPFSRFTRVLGG